MASVRADGRKIDEALAMIRRIGLDAAYLDACVEFMVGGVIDERPVKSPQALAIAA